MITDTLNSAVALATAKVVAEKKRIMINTGAASTRLTNEDCTPYTMHYTYDTYALANGTGKAVVKQGGDTWFFLTADYAFGHSLEKDTADVVKANGGKVLGQVRHPLNASDFSSFLLQAQASKAKIIGLANAGGDTINSIKAANEFGITKNQSLAGLLVFITDIHSLGLTATQGMYAHRGLVLGFQRRDPQVGQALFRKAQEDAHHGAGRRLLRDADVPEGGEGGGHRRRGCRHEMAAREQAFRLVRQERLLREDGRLVHDMYLMQVKKPEESKSPWDYYHVRATIPAARSVPAAGAVALPAGEEVIRAARGAVRRRRADRQPIHG